MTQEIFEYRLTVPASAIDERNHVNNLVYLEWCLEAAEMHWQRNASQTIRDTYIWYVLSHKIHYHGPAFEGQEVLIRTWVATAEGVRSERRYEILLVKDGSKLVTASTLWCLLSAKSERPTAITDEIRNLFWQ